MLRPNHPHTHACGRSSSRFTAQHSFTGGQHMSQVAVHHMCYGQNMVCGWKWFDDKKKSTTWVWTGMASIFWPWQPSGFCEHDITTSGESHCWMATEILWPISIIMGINLQGMDFVWCLEPYRNIAGNSVRKEKDQHGSTMHCLVRLPGPGEAQRSTGPNLRWKRTDGLIDQIQEMPQCFSTLATFLAMCNDHWKIRSIPAHDSII